MKTKKVIFFSAIVLAILAVIAGLCLFFFSSRKIEEIASSLEVVEIEGEPFLVAEYNGKYSYEFKIEREESGKFFEVDVVESEVNSINLSEQKISLVSGVTFRFSVRYVGENAKGQYSETIVWQPVLVMDAVDYASVLIEEDLISWDAVPNAASYTLHFVNADGQMSSISTNLAQFSLSGVECGSYKVYIVAVSSDINISPSDLGEGVSVQIVRKNEIADCVLESGVLSVYSTLQVEKFEIFVDGESVGTVEVADCSLFCEFYVQKIDSLLFAGALENGELVQIKSCGTAYVQESDLFELSF